MKERAAAYRRHKHLDGQHPRRRLAFSAAVGVGLLILLTACSDETKDKIQDAIDAEDPGGESPQEPAPEPEPPPETEPPPEPEPEPPPATEPEAPPEDDELSNEDWLILGLLGLAAFAIIVGATSLAARHSEAKKSAQATLQHRIHQIAGIGRWVHDQGSVDVLRLSDPDQIRSSWTTTRTQMLELEGRIAALTADVGPSDPALFDRLNQVGQTATALRGSLDSNVAIRLDPDAAAKSAMVESTTQTVLERRRDLDTALRLMDSTR